MNQYVIGAAVRSKTTLTPSESGHVKGFGCNIKGELTILVEWKSVNANPNAKPYRTFIHPDYIEIV